MHTNPKISVIVPVYNVEKYIERCVDSILNQTYKNLEIILVNDGSPDRCGDICDNYKTKDSRIKVIHKNNEGLGYARNTGLQVATGEFISFIDSDDYIEENMFEYMINKMKAVSADTCLCGHNVDYGKYKKANPILLGKYIYRGNEIVENILKNMIGNIPSKVNDYELGMSVWQGIFSHKIIQENKIYFPSERELISEDIFFDLEYYTKSKCLVIVDKCFYNYCMNDNSLTHTFKEERFEKIKVLYAEIIKKGRILGIDCELRTKRSILGRVRRQMVDIVANINGIERRRLLRNIIDDRFINSILDEYPIEKMIKKYSLFFKLMKNKNMLLLNIYLKIMVIRDYYRQKFVL